MSDFKTFGELLKVFDPSNSAFQAFPNDSICPECNRFLPGRADVEWIISQRPKVTSVPRCFCAKSLAESEERLERMATLPRSVRGPSGPRDWREASLENTRETTGNAEAKHLIKAFTLGNAAPIVILSGPPGTGKTHLLEAAGRKFIAQHKSVRYTMVASMLDSMRPTSEGDPDSDVKEYMLPQLLILDDLGAEKASEWAEEKLMAIIDDRYRNNRYLLVATNVGEVEMIHKLGPRIADRLYDVNSGKVARAHIDDLSARQSPMFAPVEEDDDDDYATH